MKYSKDLNDLLFRLLFCSIFVGLGAEHLFSDALIQHLMPAWVPAPRLVSLLCGVWLTVGGVLIALGWKIEVAAAALAFFLVVVTAAVHLPGVFVKPDHIPADLAWTWDILQRSNLVKNICLLGVCFHLQHHELGKYSLERMLKLRSIAKNATTL